MTFDPKMMMARWCAGCLYPEDLPGFAADALEAGFDGPALRALAGMRRPIGEDVGDLREKAIQEVGEPPLSTMEAALILCRKIAKEIVDGTVAPIKGASMIHAFGFDLEYPHWIDTFDTYGMEGDDPGKYVMSKELFEQEVIEEARRLLKRKEI